jgi:superfamily II DNA or RNA helicase
MLRDYQATIVDKVFEAWQNSKSVLVVLPTGMGKTQIFSEIVRRTTPARSLVIAHREELIFQAKNRLELFGVPTAVEMADQSAEGFECFFRSIGCIVSTVQTQCAGKNGGRMTRFDPTDFAQLIIDEAHHSVSPSYRRVINHYQQNSGLKLLGVTATPDRADEAALGMVYESVVCDYDIVDAIRDGWLVDVDQQMAVIEDLDFSQIDTLAGDFNAGQLADQMESEKQLHGVASATMQCVGDKKTLVFTASVKQAQDLCDIFNRHRPNCALWISGETPKEERRDKLALFASGKVQYMLNCGVLLEGYDCPDIAAIVMARPTKSRCLYSQVIGRGTRPLPGVIDGLDTKEERVAAIENSAKPTVLVLDFVGNAGKHKLICTADVLGGKYDSDVLDLAAQRAKAGGKPARMLDEIEQAAKEIAEQKRKAKFTAKAKFATASVDPFDVLGLTPWRKMGWDSGRALTPKQSDLLRKQGLDPDAMEYHEAKQILSEIFRRFDTHEASFKQCKLLGRFGYDTRGMSFDEASQLITQVKAAGWKRPTLVAV